MLCANITAMLQSHWRQWLLSAPQSHLVSPQQKHPGVQSQRGPCWPPSDALSLCTPLPPPKISIEHPLWRDASWRASTEASLDLEYFLEGINQVWVKVRVSQKTPHSCIGLVTIDHAMRGVGLQWLRKSRVLRSPHALLTQWRGLSLTSGRPPCTHSPL